MKRITNQHESLLLPEWTQSQFSLSDMNNDTMSIHTLPRTKSLSDFNTDFDKQSIMTQNQHQYHQQQLVRQDTGNSRRSHSNNGSVVHTPI